MVSHAKHINVFEGGIFHLKVYFLSLFLFTCVPRGLQALASYFTYSSEIPFQNIIVKNSLKCGSDV